MLAKKIFLISLTAIIIGSCASNFKTIATKSEKGNISSDSEIEKIIEIKGLLTSKAIVVIRSDGTIISYNPKESVMTEIRKNDEGEIIHFRQIKIGEDRFRRYYGRYRSNYRSILNAW